MSLAARINVPLLPEHKPKIEIKHATLPGAVFNVATSIIGAGIMSIPATLKVLGVIPAFLLIVIIAMLADVSVEFLMRFTHSGHSRTYAGVMRESFGRGGAVAAQVCVMVTNLGCLIMYLIIIGDVLSGNQPEGVVHLGILQQWFGINWWNSREFALLVTVVFIMLPLVLFRRVESLKFSSAISVLLAVVFVGISSAMAISALLEGKTETPRMLPHLDDQVSFFDLFTAVPVIVTAFTFHFNESPTFQNLRMKLDQQDARMDTPLLEDVLENQNSSQGASISGAVFNITTTMIGAGIMSIPAAIKVLGIIPGFLLILVVAFFTEVTVEFLLRYTKSGKSTTYAGIVGESFGAIGSVAVQICVIITLFGALIIYLIIIGDVLCGSKSGETLHIGILQEWFGIHWWNSRAFAILFIVLFVMLPLVWQKRVDSLKYTSAISVLLAVLFVVICSAMAIQALWEGKSTQKLRLLPDFSEVSVFDLFTTVPIFVTGFGFHVNVHPIRVELGKPTEMSLAVRISLAITVAIYSAIGFFGYLLFGDSIMSDMLVNFDQNSDTTIGKLLDVIVRLTYAIHLLLVFPLLNFTLRANIDELLFPKKPILASDTLRFVSLTCVLLAITYIIAIAIPDIWLFFQFMGSTTVVCLSFIFPVAIILRDVHGISTTRDKIIAILVILLAVGTSTIAISTSLYG